MRRQNADPAMPEAIYNRAADNWRPLIAVADAAGGDWPARARDVAVAAVTDQPDDGSRRTKLLSDIRDAFAAAAVDRMASVTLCAALAAREDSPWAEAKAGKPITPIGLAKLLAPFKIAPRNIRLPSGETPKGYPLDAFAEAFNRYLPPAPPPPRNATTPQPNNGGVFAHSGNATGAGAWRLEKREKPSNGGPCGVVAFPKGDARRARGRGRRAMSAARALLHALRDAGVSLGVAGDRLRWTGPAGAMTPALLGELRERKAELLALLTPAPTPNKIRTETWPDAEREAIEERAAILEYDAGLPRAWAEGAARLLAGLPPPARCAPWRWQQLRDDAAELIRAGWPAKAAALGWHAAELFGASPTRPEARHDAQGWPG